MHYVLVFLYVLLFLGSLYLYARSVPSTNRFLVTALSPVASFGMIVLLAFFVRPLLFPEDSVFATSNEITASAQLTTSLLGFASMFFFALGALIAMQLSRSPLVWLSKPLPEMPFPSSSGQQLVALYLSIILAISWVLLLMNGGVFNSLNILELRIAYLSFLPGNGHLFLLFYSSVVFLAIALFYSRYTGSVPRLALAVALPLALACALVGERQVAASILFMLFFTYLIRAITRSERIPLARVATALLVLVVVGTVVGIARGLEDFGFEVGMIDGLRFFLLTFDMAYVLQAVLLLDHELDLGRQFFEDVLWTYVPRALFLDKPTIYGTTRTQIMFLPETAPSDDVFLATYPIGFWGEAIFALSYPGLVVITLLSAIALNWLYLRAIWGRGLRFISRSASLFAFTAFTFLLWNGLTVARSFGQTLAALVFLATVVALAHGISCFLAILLHSSRHTAHSRKRIEDMANPA